MGAVVGGMYLALGSSTAVVERWREAIDRQLIPSVRSMGARPDAGAREHPLLQAARRIKSRLVVTLAMNRSSLIDGGDLRDALEFLIPDIDIGDLPIPFVAVATDLETGEEVRCESGSLRQALHASSSIPGVVPAVEVDGRKLVDGGVLAEIPVATAHSLGWPVVAVDVSMDLPPYSPEVSVLSTMMRTQLMTSIRLRKRQLSTVDRVIRPEVGGATWSDWDQFDDLVEAGRKAAREWIG
jgi:NTE family protein